MSDLEGGMGEQTDALTLRVLALPVGNLMILVKLDVPTLSSKAEPKTTLGLLLYPSCPIFAIS